MAAKKKTTKKKTAAKKKTSARKKASPKPKPAPAPSPTAPDPPEFGILLYLRNPSRHWPQKIRDFRFSKEFGKWIWKGEPVPLDEWNETQESILDEVSTYDFLVHPGMMIVDRLRSEETEEKEIQAWQKGLAAAKEKKEEVKEPEPEPTPDPDERQRPPERPPTETLY